MNLTWNTFTKLITDNLTDDLLTPKYRRMKKLAKLPKSFGQCYVASETAFYLLGGKEEGWKAMHMKHEGFSHWFLKHESGLILDLTNDQFKTTPNYENARGAAFLTKEPSKRAKKLLIRIKDAHARYGLPFTGRASILV